MCVYIINGVIQINVIQKLLKTIINNKGSTNINNWDHNIFVLNYIWRGNPVEWIHNLGWFSCLISMQWYAFLLFVWYCLWSRGLFVSQCVTVPQRMILQPQNFYWFFGNPIPAVFPCCFLLSFLSYSSNYWQCTGSFSNNYYYFLLDCASHSFHYSNFCRETALRCHDFRSAKCRSFAMCFGSFCVFQLQILAGLLLSLFFMV